MIVEGIEGDLDPVVVAHMIARKKVGAYVLRIAIATDEGDVEIVAGVAEEGGGGFGDWRAVVGILLNEAG